MSFCVFYSEFVRTWISLWRVSFMFASPCTSLRLCHSIYASPCMSLYACLFVYVSPCMPLYLLFSLYVTSYMSLTICHSVYFPFHISLCVFVSGCWIGVTGMINIQDTTGLTKRAINRIVITITNCYWTIVDKAHYESINISALRQDTHMSCKSQYYKDSIL